MEGEEAGNLEELLEKVSRDILGGVQKQISAVRDEMRKIEGTQKAQIEALQNIVKNKVDANDDDENYAVGTQMDYKGEIFNEELPKPLMYFEGEEDESPIEFISYFERKFGRIVNEQKKLDLFEQHLKGRALTWFKFILEETRGYDEAQRRFREYFWGERIQERVMSRLNKGKYQAGGKEKPDEYCIRLYQTCKELDAFPVSESMKVQKISKHFWGVVQHRGNNPRDSDFPGPPKLSEQVSRRNHKKGVPGSRTKRKTYRTRKV